ncbi:MAG: hypothetical protein GX584_11425, partial [Clostridiaceae bacterium]|nr:hypothetical protein [Clostridiaceae bacterium]
MNKNGAVKIILIILIMSALLTSCTEEEYRASKLYRSLTSYEQVGETVTLKNKKYNRVYLTEEAQLDMSKVEIYNADFDQAVMVEDSSLALLNSQVLSKTIAITSLGKETIINAISSEMASYGLFVLDVSDKALFTGSNLKITNLSENGSGINVRSEASMVINNSNVSVKGVGVETDAIVSISNSEITSSSLKFYEGASVTLTDSRFYTDHGLLLVDNPTENKIHVSLNLEKVKLNTTYGAALSMIDAKASVKISESTIGQNSKNVMSLSNSEGTLTLCNTTIEGNINTDETSSLNILLKQESVLIGQINNENKYNTVTIQIEEASVWELTQDSYVRGIILKDKTLNG